MRLRVRLLSSVLGLFFIFTDMGADPVCPIVIDPPTVVVKYGDPVSANCTVRQTTRGMGWETSVGSIDMQTDVQSLLWSVSRLTDWTAEPKCYANFQTEPKQCVKKLDITLYKLPDSVSIRPIPGKKKQEWNQTELHCDVVNVAPARFLTLKWLKGETLVQEKLFNDITEKDPRNITETLLITLSRSDDGVQYTCVSELRLGPGGPQPNPVMKSEPLSIIVLPSSAPRRNAIVSSVFLVILIAELVLL
ncbi:intercellular adhesion molecule 1 [Amia ocellicauda]|uniref:intercellular adhesion molecule 1 n=1 Tax=Amia ocellicauda TaxID=2972642 RepID=UPI003463C068